MPCALVTKLNRGRSCDGSGCSYSSSFIPKLHTAPRPPFYIRKYITLLHARSSTGFAPIVAYDSRNRPVTIVKPF